MQGLGKDFAYFGAHTHDTLENMAWGDGPMNSFICEIYRQTRHKHSMDTRWPTKLSGKRRRGGKGNEGATRKKGTLGPVSFRLKANQVTTLQQPFPVSLASIKSLSVLL